MELILNNENKIKGIDYNLTEQMQKKLNLTSILKNILIDLGKL